MAREAEVLDPPAVAGRRVAMGYEEWLAWGGDAEFKSEWVDGEAIVHMSTKVLHARLSGFLFVLLSQYVRFTRLGEVLAETIEMRIGRVSRVPDILFVATEHADRVTERRLEEPADLVIEFVSADSVERDRDEKFREYQAAGIPEYWLVEARPGPRAGEAEFFRLVDDVYRPVALDADGRYHSAVVAGFWLRPEWLRQEPLPDPWRLLAAIAPEAVRDALGGGDGGEDAPVPSGKH